MITASADFNVYTELSFATSYLSPDVHNLFVIYQLPHAFAYLHPHWHLIVL